MVKRHVQKALALMFAVAVGFAGPVAVSVVQDTLKIGAPFNTPPGEGLINAAKMATEDINNAGGINGKKIELVIANDEYKSFVGANAYERLVLSDKVVVVVGALI